MTENALTLNPRVIRFAHDIAMELLRSGKIESGEQFLSEYEESLSFAIERFGLVENLEALKSPRHHRKTLEEWESLGKSRGYSPGWAKLRYRNQERQK